MAVNLRQRAAIRSLKQDLKAIRVTDEQSLLEYIPLASRLTALGALGTLKNWFRPLARPFSSRLEAILVERSEEGMWDLRQGIGQDLGLAIIDAQDFFCFLRQHGSVLPVKGRRFLKAWIEEAERTALDEDAAAMLRRFLRYFPVPREYRLTVVDTPLTLFEEEVLAGQR